MHPSQKYATMKETMQRVCLFLMARSDGYNTKTRQLILDYLINNRQHAVSASNILEHLDAVFLFVTRRGLTVTVNGVNQWYLDK